MFSSLQLILNLKIFPRTLVGPNVILGVGIDFSTLRLLISRHTMPLKLSSATLGFKTTVAIVSRIARCSRLRSAISFDFEYLDALS